MKIGVSVFKVSSHYYLWALVSEINYLRFSASVNLTASVSDLSLRSALASANDLLFYDLKESISALSKS